MVQSLESRIHNLLLEHGDSLKVADLLLNDWSSGRLGWMEQETVGFFLIKCGFLTAFCDQISKNLKNSQKIPWGAFAEALSESKLKLTKEDFDQLFVAAGEEQALKDLVKCKKFDHLDPRFQKIRNSMDNTILRAEPASPSEIAPLKENREAAQTHVMTPRAVPPASEKADFFDEVDTSTLIAHLEALDQRDEALIESTTHIFKKTIQNKPHLTDESKKEAAIALGMMGAWGEGLEILRLSAPTLQRNLLELQFLIQANKPLEVLELSEQSLKRKPNLEQKSFIQFCCAKASLQLKRTQESFDLLQEIVEENPDHFGARALLAELRQGKK